MLFAVSLLYKKSPEEVKAQLEPHKRWLAKFTQAEKILVAGPFEGAPGGYLLANCDHLDELNEMLAEDPFSVHALASFETLPFNPAIRAEAFPAAWAPAAVAVAKAA